MSSFLHHQNVKFLLHQMMQVVYSQDRLKKNIPSSTTGISSVIGSENPLNPATIKNVTPFNLSQQSNPSLYNQVQVNEQKKKDALSERLSQIQNVYDQAQ